jgi:hypothetical protein
MRIFLSTTAIFVLVILAQNEAHAAESADEEFIGEFLKSHCVRCHNRTDLEGDLNLGDLGLDITRNRSTYAGVLKRLDAGDMPPEDEPQPDNGAVRRVTRWIQAGLAAQAEALEVPVRPGQWNQLPHSVLFGNKPGPSVPPPPRLWRLSPSGYSAGLLHCVHVEARQIPQPFALRSDPGIKDYAALYWIDEGSTDVLIRNAEKIVELLTKHRLNTPKGGGPVRVSPEVRSFRGERIRPPQEFAPLLHPEIAPQREQLEAAIRVLYRMVLIRDPSDEEVQSLVTLYEKCAEPPGDRVSAARTMLMAPLLSPEALHRFELGRGAEVRPGVRMLSPDELAFALSLAFSGQREPGLFEAAANGGLTTREDVAEHVRRILDDPEIYKPRILGFFHEYFGYDRAPEVCKDAQPDYVHQADQLVLDAEIDYYATDKKAVPKRPKDKRKDGVEAAYGLEEWPANQPVDLPGDRIGILMQPSWLVAWSSNFFNDPVRRGLWIRERLLGQPVPPVPVGVVIVLPDDPTQTLRQRMQITKNEACWKCHQKIDDLGFPFEAFDHFGRPREQEITFDMEAAATNRANAARKYARGEKRPETLPEYHHLPLDTTGMVYASGDPQLDGPVENAPEMIRRLAESERGRQVFIRYVFRYFMGRNETPGDAATLQQADKAYVESGGSFKELVVSLLTSESFLYRTVSIGNNAER